MGLVPEGLAVLLQLEEAVLPPRPGANLDQLAAEQQELQVRVSLQTWRERWHADTARGQVTNISRMSEGGSLMLKLELNASPHDTAKFPKQGLFQGPCDRLIIQLKKVG